MTSKSDHDEARGASGSFWPVFIFPQIADGRDLRARYVSLLDQWGWTHSNEPRQFEEYERVVRRTEEARFFTGENGSLIINSFGLSCGYVSSALDSVVLSFWASQEGEMWTCNLF